MDKDLFVLLLIVVIRGCAPLLILRWQFAGGLLCILADTSDSILQDALGAEPLAGHYHLVDKSFDIYYLAFECGVALWRWTDPLARGLEAIATGYSLRFPNDMENIEHQFEVYDALYAWCRLDLAKS